MGKEKTDPDTTLALSTKVEEDFVAPLTALRGSLEILRDFPDLAEDERLRFMETALRGCATLENAVKELGQAVYAAGQKAQKPVGQSPTSEEHKRYAGRIHILNDIDTIEIDLSDLQFSSNQIVNQFHDVLEEQIEASGRKWYFIVNYRNCTIWPEAWVTFAHRGKRISDGHSLATVRYVETDEPDQGAAEGFGPDMFASREKALAKLDEIKSQARLDA